MRYPQIPAGTHIAFCGDGSANVYHINNLNKPTVYDFGHQLKLVQSEYSEMPGLHLSKLQAQRLWNLDPGSCDVIFDALEAAHFLRRTRTNFYVRATIDY